MGRMRSMLWVVPVGVLAVGCTSGGAQPPVTTTQITTVTASPAPATSQPSASTTPPSAATTGAGESADGPVPALPGRTRGINTFRSPTGNILCYIAYEDGPASTECDIREADFPEKAEPADCDLDWQGRYVTVADGSPEIGRCAGDPSAAWVYNQDGGEVLQYGETTLVVNMACQSQRDGMTCWNIETKRGFKLNRSALQVF